MISPIKKLDAAGVDFTEIFLNQIVRPAAQLAGDYQAPIRADRVRAPGSITAKVVADIVNADICIADLTGRNPNVMYEVAIAHAAGKPVILLQQEDGGPPFDFADERVIHYSLRVDEANHARDQLVDHLRNAHHDENDPQLAKVLNPVRMIFRDIRTKEQAVPAEQLILDRLENLYVEVRRLSSRPALTEGLRSRGELSDYDRILSETVALTAEVLGDSKAGIIPSALRNLPALERRVWFLQVLSTLLLAARSEKTAGHKDSASTLCENADEMLRRASAGPVRAGNAIRWPASLASVVSKAASVLGADSLPIAVLHWLDGY